MWLANTGIQDNSSLNLDCSTLVTSIQDYDEHKEEKQYTPRALRIIHKLVTLIFLISYKHQIGHSLYIDTRRLLNASFRSTIESGRAIPYWDQNYEKDFTKSEFPCFFRLTLLQNSRLDIGRTDGLIFIADVVEFPRPKWFTSSIYKFKPK